MRIIRIDKEKRGLVRGVLEITPDRQQFEDVVAYTMWHRHDEPELGNVLTAEVNRLCKVYMTMKVESVAIHTEWREYGTVRNSR